ncbi:hypothetical protein [Vulcanisaeta distributa]|uniref:hypothetical protein n=1 Tax=Vulcanisaeta distributa TaxID=164451 RepID=UPI000AB38262|nr:hypothetical protein [Vulcanisaeta distributa]
MRIGSMPCSIAVSNAGHASTKLSNALLSNLVGAVPISGMARGYVGWLLRGGQV